jgi:DNA-binding LacI/PurR family transcriptional regulator
MGFLKRFSYNHLKNATMGSVMVPVKKRHTPVNLKYLAEWLGLSQATVSMALSRSAESSGVALKTRERVRSAATELNYQPNFHARSLSSGRSYTVGILAPDISEGYYATIISGIEDYLLQEGYFFFMTCHRWQANMVEELPEAMLRRGIEGLIAINTQLPNLHFPSVRIGGSQKHIRSTNIRLDEDRGTRLALEYLVRHGHREIAFFRGEPEGMATEDRWDGILKAAHSLNIKVEARRTVQLNLDDNAKNVQGAWIGYSAAQELLRRKVPFTALLAYNDSTAIGAMRAFQDAGLSVPQAVSVLGYDDIPAAQYERPALTTIRQPLQSIGSIAAETLLKRINGKPVKSEILIQPQFVERNSVRTIDPRIRVRKK